SDKVAKRVKCWQSDDYIYGTWHDFTPCIKGCFDWGIADIELQISKGIIKEAKIATDSLFPSSVELAKKLLTGKNSIDINNMATNDAIAGDIINLVRGKLCTI
ncbi:MAG TPA: lipoate protein ligase C-terminal domain-containing protein, partial [Clostridia bacterium]|nr:lipoate protein ligase C-terminal domain-containing protein [Clostridia bacterium]